MLSIFTNFFSDNGLLPHGHCYLWIPSLLWTQVASDALIAISYFSIPIALWYFVTKRPDFPFKWLLVMFGVFVMACGTTHIFSIVNIWSPHYWEEAAVKVFTAAVSLLTAIMAWPLVPKALAIPSPDQLRLANIELQNEVLRRRDVEKNLQIINQSLEKRTIELEAANKELESFSYSVSHDLRAPVRHIQGYSKLLLDESKHLSEDEMRYLDGIIETTTKMGRLVDDLLAFSRTGRMNMRRETVDLTAVVEAARLDCMQATDGRPIEWEIGKLASVQGDPTLLEVVFTNLLSNAVKFTRGRKPSVIQIDCQLLQVDEVVISVKDNGVGFDPRFQNKLFGVFQRLHGEDEFEGTGIGLVTVQRIVERHGGRIWAESKLGEGASFFFTLKIAS